MLDLTDEAGHSATLYQGEKLLVYGGENEHREYLSDIVILDLKSLHWTQPDVRGPIPKGRARHASVIYEDKLFVVGGLTGETNYILDDICYLDLKTWTWSKCWSFVPRFDHTAWIWGGRLWVFGGLGPDMERSTEIWWLDLKGSPSFGMASSQAATSTSSSLNRSPAPQMGTLGNSQHYGSSGYAANSGSVQVRSSRKEKPTAPGAISSLKFLSGPHVPVQASGMHFHAYSSGTLLDFVTPAGTIRSSDCNLSSLELDSLRWQRLVEGPELFDVGYRWLYCTISEDGTKAWLLGSPFIGDTISPNQDVQLSEVLSMDLKKYGMLGNDLVHETVSEQSRILASEHTASSPSHSLGIDLAAVFDQSPESGSMSDFIITANQDDFELIDAEEAGAFRASPSQSEYLPENAATSPPIHVHKIILQARWPHFKRLYNAKMAEFHNQKMHIPEPYAVVRAFLYYLYTDSIAPHRVYCSDLTEVAGMLVMANLYDMPKLRLLCVHRLSRELDVEHAAIVWERASRTNEEWLKKRAASFCMMHWGRLVRTDGFRSLSQHRLIELCEQVDTEGRVIGGEELEGFGGGGFGYGVGSRKQRHGSAHIATASEDIEDGEGDEDDGMELN
ncbi:MAG: hypothetical protein Q9160_005026 [Pyrenula sp. 1 TL-2023]